MKERLPLIVNVAICLAMGAVTAFGIVTLRQPLPVVVADLARPADVQVQVDRAPEARLLGADVSGGVVPPAVQISGLVAGGRASAAVLSIEGRPPQSFNVGDELINGWQLSQVLVDEVVIERLGRSARVRMPERPSVDGLILRDPGRVAPAP